MLQHIDTLAESTIESLVKARSIDSIENKAETKKLLINVIKEVALVANQFDSTTTGWAKFDELKLEKNGVMSAKISLMSGRQKSETKRQQMDLILAPDLSGTIRYILGDKPSKEPFGDTLVQVKISNIYSEAVTVGENIFLDTNGVLLSICL